MKKLNILEGPSGIPAIALGLMHMPALAKDEAARVLANAVDLGVNFLSGADVTLSCEERYGLYLAEREVPAVAISCS